MIAAWIGYCLLVSALLGLAALLAERALGHYRKPVRWVWAGAIAGSLLLPVVAYLVPSVLRVAGVPLSVELLPLAGVSGTPVDATVAEPAAGLDMIAWLTSANVLLLGMWVGSIVLLGSYLAMTFGRLRGEMRSWTPGRILDAPVLVSRDRGPAVIGLRRSVIVLPQWISELRDDVLRLIFLHEREHQAAGDQRLFALGVVGTLAMPWNPIMWWQLRRLRLGIEFDCDHRVIVGGVPAREYAEALLEVGSRISHPPLAAAAFAERRSAVERRLHRMTQPLRRLRGPRALIAGIGAALLIVFACESPLPMSPTTDTADEPTASADEAPAADLTRPQLDDPSERPSFIPYDEPPRLTNGEETSQKLREVYPRALLDAGIGGRVELWLYVNEEGSVVKSQVKTSSGKPALDQAATTIVEQMVFNPARYEGQATHVWVSQWIAFMPERQPISTAEPGDRQNIQIQTEGGRLRLSTEAGEALATGAEPLVIVDGAIQEAETAVAELNPDDVDYIEVIKGEAARALYGDRGSYGVILITTKAAARDEP